MSWMLWVEPTAIFFSLVALMLICMTIWELVQPTVERKGLLLPMPTTRGDRLFIGLMASAYLNAAWLGWASVSQWWAVVISVLMVIAIMRWG